MTTPPPVWLPGHGFLTHDGRHYPDKLVKAALISLMEWWEALDDLNRHQLLTLAARLEAMEEDCQ
jgi:hypothetical protein